jgi:carbamoyltransferase
VKSAILGVSTLGHDAATALVDADSGEILYAIAEERLTNLKHTSRFPIASLRAAQEYARANDRRIEAVALSFVPAQFSSGTLQRELEKHIADASVREPLWGAIEELLKFGDYFQEGSFAKKTLEPLLTKIVDEDARGIIERRIGWCYNWSVKYRWLQNIVAEMFPEARCEGVNHHFTHAVSAYFNSGHDTACVITWDGQGESQTICVYDAAHGALRLVAETHWPTSLGILYFGVTNYLGFKLGDEFKVMGMAAYGQPVYYDLFHQLLQFDKSLEIAFAPSPYYGVQEFDEGHHWNYFSEEMGKLVPKRRRSDPILQAHFDLAASLQKAFEDFGAEFAQKALEKTGRKNICLAGGVALNGLMNEAIRRRTKCEKIFVFPAAGDDGCAVGAAQALVLAKSPSAPKAMGMPFYGGGSSEQEIRALLKDAGVAFDEPPDMHRRIAEALVEGKIVARFTGRSEFGPRALGNRSIMASAQTPEMKDTLNIRIKHREQFRPFAPACLLEHAPELFDLDVEAPFMLLIAQARDSARQKIPAAVHSDGTSRVQTVSEQTNPSFYRTIKSFHELTGIPAIINTSFNINGEAIVETAQDALESFAQMDIDYLALEGFWIDKTRNADRFPKQSDEAFLEIRKKRYQHAFDHPLKNLEIYHDYFVRPKRGKDEDSRPMTQKVHDLFRSLWGR